MDTFFSNNEPIQGLKYCTRCCVPETQEGVQFDEMGICTACRSSEEKMHINWVEREKQLRSILDDVKKKSGDGYDCVLPISGGKDSFFQAHVLVNVYGLKPLAVTFNQNWGSETGYYNLQRCLQVFNLDHMQFTPSRSLVNKLARKSLSAIGDACWHCHSGIGSFALQIATKFEIPLLIWGESVAESSGRASYLCPAKKFDRDYFTRVSAKKTADEMVDAKFNITAKDIQPFQLPSYEEIEKTGVWGIHLGDYIFWDEEKQTEWIKKVYGWKETEMEGTYKGYKSAECIMSGIHDFTGYLKRGMARTTMHASFDVRNGLMTREEAFELIKKYEHERPEVLDYYLKITGMTEAEFYKTMSELKMPHLKNVDLPVNAKTDKHSEVLVPFNEQIIAKHLNAPDPRTLKEQGLDHE